RVRDEERGFPRSHGPFHVGRVGGIPHQETMVRHPFPWPGLELPAAVVTDALHGISCSPLQWGQQTTWRGGADLLGISQSWPVAVCHLACNSEARSSCGPGSAALAISGGTIPASRARSPSNCWRASLPVPTSRSSASSLAESASASVPMGS